MEEIVSWRENGKTRKGSPNQRYAAMQSDESLLRILDELVTDREDELYRAVRDQLKRRMETTRNPFHAGRPREKEELTGQILLMNKQGFSTRKIAKELSCSQSKVCRIIKEAGES